MRPAYFAHYVTDVVFRRELFGYHRDDVERHLKAVQGWFSFAGIEEPLQDRINELQADADRRLREANAEAARIVNDARRQAREITSTASREADALLAQARREAELERRGSSRIGRPVGDGRSVARSQLRATPMGPADRR